MKSLRKLTKEHVLWYTPEETPYHRFFFDALRRSGIAPLVTYDAGVQAHPWTNMTSRGSNTRTPFLGLIWGGGKSVQRVLSDDRLFVISGWQKPKYIVLLSLLVILRRRFIFWTDTPSNHRRPLILASVRWIVSRLVFSEALLILSTGRPGAGALVSMGCDKHKVVVFPFYVPINEQGGCASTGEVTQEIRFFSAGRLDCELKGFDIGIRAFALALATHPRLQMTYRIAGTGKHMRYLASLADSLGVSSRVKLLGWLDYENMQRELRACSAFVHPALVDPFPVVVLEAMAVGKPVLGSDKAGSVLDRVSHGESGFIHKAGSVDELASHMVTIAQDAKRAEVLGLGALRIAEQWPAMRGVNVIKSTIEQLAAPYVVI